MKNFKHKVYHSKPKLNNDCVQCTCLQVFRWGPVHVHLHRCTWPRAQMLELLFSFLRTFQRYRYMLYTLSETAIVMPLCLNNYFIQMRPQNRIGITYMIHGVFDSPWADSRN